jgi:hypothetical protein
MGMRFDLHLLGKPDEEGYAPTLRLRMLNVESLDEAVRIGMEGVSQARTPTAWGLRLFDELGREVYCWSSETKSAQRAAAPNLNCDGAP